MKMLMISLDKKILDKDSRVAERMIGYGKKDELFIIIPHTEKKTTKLSETVHVQTTGGNKIQQYFRLKKLGKQIIEKEKIELITTQDPFFTGLVGVWLKKKAGVKLEVQLHGDFFGSDYYKKQNRLRYFLGKSIIKKADKLRVVGERAKKGLLDFSIPEEKIEVRPVKINTEFIKNYETRLNLKKGYSDYSKIFLVLGRLESVKNISWIIDLFAEIIKDRPSYLLLIVGEGSELENLKSKVKNLKLEGNIKFESWTNEPIAYLKGVDCLLFPSLSEGYGMVVIEAYVAGCPVIMNDVGVADYEIEPCEMVKVISTKERNKWIQSIKEV